MESPFYTREVKLMGEQRIKAEIEVLNNSGFEQIVHKVLRRKFF